MLKDVRGLRVQVKGLRERAGPKDAELAKALAAVDQKLAALEGAAFGPRGGGGTRGAGDAGPASLTRLQGQLAAVLRVVESADAAPTTQAVAASDEVQEALATLVLRWLDLWKRDIRAVNEQLRQANLPLIEEESAAKKP